MKTQQMILVISGNQDLQEACRKALAPGNYAVRAADSLPAGLRLAQGEHMDMVLLDGTALREGAAASLLPRLWERDPDVAYLVLSDPSSLDLATEALRQGADDVVRVPAPPELLLHRVTRALERRTNAIEIKRLQTFEQDVSQLWSVARGELEGFDQFNKDFVGLAAFRLTVAHEFRAPIAALVSFLLLLLKGYVPPEQQPRIIQHAIDRSQDLLDLVDDLLDLATAKEEQSSTNRSLVRLGDELEKVIPTLKAEAEAKGLTLTLHIRQKPTVEVNALQMGPLWTNLISNAIKYTRAGGHVRVFLDQDEEWAIGTVEDTGIGIAPKDQPLIFHEFYRAPQAKEMERRGTGLGLPLVKRIVEGYGGRVEVESTLGTGSRFRFTLPLATASKREEGMLEGDTF